MLPWLIAAITHRIKDFPEEAIHELFGSLDAIERKYDLIKPLSEADRGAIEKSHADVEAGRFVTHEELLEKYPDVFKDYDRDATGRKQFLEATQRVQKLPGEQQGGVADVIWALLDEVWLR